ncbi:hypothetical protein KKE45_01680 [Patescibacteria group bacterium]|nr:hypothetical protein [Patescibacteria group bacterium]
MSSKTKIKYEIEGLDKLPFFNKKELAMVLSKSGKNLDKTVQRLLDRKYLIPIKKGLYVSANYLKKIKDKTLYIEFLANKICYPSYVSLEYVLAKNGIIPEIVQSITNITVKSTRVLSGKLGDFVYGSIGEDLFFGYKTIVKDKYKIRIASTAKALFDYLYLKRNLGNLKYELKEGLRINWDNLNREILKEFGEYVKLSKSKKMKKIWLIIKKTKDDIEWA